MVVVVFSDFFFLFFDFFDFFFILFQQLEDGSKEAGESLILKVNCFKTEVMLIQYGG